MKYLITGGCGFIGSKLAAEILKRGENLILFDNLFRFGSSQNLECLKRQGKIMNSKANINGLEKLGWKPEFSLEKGIDKYLKQILC